MGYEGGRDGGGEDGTKERGMFCGIDDDSVGSDVVMSIRGLRGVSFRELTCGIVSSCACVGLAQAGETASVDGRGVEDECLGR